MDKRTLPQPGDRVVVAGAHPQHDGMHAVENVDTLVWTIKDGETVAVCPRLDLIEFADPEVKALRAFEAFLAALGRPVASVEIKTADGRSVLLCPERYCQFDGPTAVVEDEELGSQVLLTVPEGLEWLLSTKNVR